MSMEVDGEKNVEEKTEVKTEEKVEEGDEKVVSEKKKRGRKRKEDSTGTPNPAKKPKSSQVKNKHSGALKNRKLILKNVQIFDSKKFVVRFRFYWRPPEGFHFHWRGLKNAFYNLNLYAG